jgi:hypothetical protein
MILVEGIMRIIDASTEVARLILLGEGIYHFLTRSHLLFYDLLLGTGNTVFFQGGNLLKITTLLNMMICFVSKHHTCEL